MSKYIRMREKIFTLKINDKIKLKAPFHIIVGYLNNRKLIDLKDDKYYKIIEGNWNDEYKLKYDVVYKELLGRKDIELL